MRLFPLDTDRPGDYILYVRRSPSARRSGKLSPRQQQTLIQRALAARSWDELQMLIQPLSDL